jgi:hypothetical protein
MTVRLFEPKSFEGAPLRPEPRLVPGIARLVARPSGASTNDLERLALLSVERPGSSQLDGSRSVELEQLGLLSLESSSPDSLSDALRFAL